MTRTLRCALLLFAAAGAAPALAWPWSGPDLGCSSDGTAATLEKIVAEAILKGAPVEIVAKVTLDVGEANVRTTDASTDKKHVCFGELEVTVAYDGPPRLRRRSSSTPARPATAAGPCWTP
jgi:hypothetical protein